MSSVHAHAATEHVAGAQIRAAGAWRIAPAAWRAKSTLRNTHHWYRMRRCNQVVGLFRQGMKQLNRTLTRGAADGQAISDFRSLADATTSDGAPRYKENTHLHWLARVVAGEHVGINRDAPIYELCHLVVMIDAVSPGTHGRWMAFLGLSRQSGPAFRDWFVQTVNENGWQKPKFDVTPKGIKWTIDGRDYLMLFNRMPSLAALFEFMIGMENAAYYGEIEGVFTQICDGYVNDAKIRTGSNALAKLLRRYRRAHFARAQYEEWFNALYRHLEARSPSGHIVIDDESILTFWLSGQSSDLISYTKVAEAFIKLHRLFATASIGDAIDSAEPIGEEHAEWDVAADVVDEMPRQSWCSPFDVLDKPPADAIKFLKKKSEREPLKNLAKYGPEANLLPLTILRLDSFGPIQSAISNDLRLNRGTLADRLSCKTATPYSEICETLYMLQAHLLALQKATLWAIHTGSKGITKHDDKVVVFPRSPELSAYASLEDLEEDERVKVLLSSKKSFNEMTRKGFDPALLDDDGHLMGFYVGAGAILEIAGVLERFLRGLDGRVEQLDRLFVDDRGAFTKRFQSLYGGLQ